MNKSALKSFATEARLELLEKTQLQARKLGITPDAIQHASLESSDAIFIDGKPLSDVERKQRNKLITRVNEIGYDLVMEEAAYTWFNRFIALRYMEVNDYLPTKVRVLSSVNLDSTEPDMFKEALNLDLPIDKEFVYNLKIENKTDELFKYLIKIHCNDLNRYMPFMFETIEGYTEVLFPEGLLGTNTFVRAMTDVNVIPEEDWANVEIVGWLYQYYISEENERVIQAKKKYKKEEIPYATQLFTPEWIVRYMVQNALGRYWVESHPEHRDLIANWEYYLENPNSEPDFEEKLAPYINKQLNVEDIKCFDPAMGSGHILSYMFDVLFEIYSKCGYMEREIPRLVIEKNLYGLDIDHRAYQLASFTLVMKGIQYNSRFLRNIEREPLKINLAVIYESNTLLEDVEELINCSLVENMEEIKMFFNQFKDAKSIGSLIKLQAININNVCNFKLNLETQQFDLFIEDLKENYLTLIEKLILQYEIMNGTYDILVTNPPYMGSRYMETNVSNYLKKNYNWNADLFSVFMEYSFGKVMTNGHIGMITPFVWMFLSAYEQLRDFIVGEKSISSLIQLEYNSFEAAVVPVCTFTMRNTITSLMGQYIRLADFTGVENQPLKTLEAIKDPNVPYRFSKENKFFNNLPDKPIGYWIPDELSKVFSKAHKLLDYIDVTGSQNITADNDRFLRKLWEVKKDELNGKWCLYIKGGNYRKWYGNIEYVVNWSEEAIKYYRENKTSNLLNEKYWFRKGLTYNGISNRGFSVRLARDGIYDKKGPTFHIKEELISENYVLGLLNSKVIDFIMNVFNPTMSYQMKDVNNIPILIPSDNEKLKVIESIVEENIKLSKYDWNSKEISLDFKKHLFIENSGDIRDVIVAKETEFEERFEQVKRNEEILNRYFIELYNMQDFLLPSIDERDVTISKFSGQLEVKSFISYAIGCILGRYSINKDGVMYAGGEFDPSLYGDFKADEDNIVPVLQQSYFADDLLSRVVEFVSIVFKPELIEENLDVIASLLGKKKAETSRETIQRYLLTDFYKDHVQTYKKRPIYWLFTSGKEKAFNCLIYMHRYDKTTLSRIRTDYVHEVQNRMDAEKDDLLNIINGDSTVKEIASAKKELKLLEKKIDELKKYDELLHHMADQQIEIDLDDGVKHNYELFKGLVASIK